MKNTTQKNGFLAGIQSSTLEDNPKKLGNAQIRSNIILCAVCFISLLFLLWVYFKWQTIPIRMHYFNTELIASREDERTIQVQLRIEEPKTLDLDKEFKIKLFNDNSQQKDDNNSNKSDIKTSIESCTYTNSLGHIVTHPLQQFPTTPMQYTVNKKLLLDYIGQPLFNELNDKCKDDDIELGLFTELFFYRHLDNEKPMERKKSIEHKLEFEKNKNCGEYYWALEKNKFVLSDFSREKKLGIYTFGFENEEINKYSIKHSKTGFKNITQSYIIAPYRNCFAYNSSIETSFVAPKLVRFLRYLSRLEDISQSYYSITLDSKTIPVLSLHLEFFGSIECLYDSSNLYDVKVDKNRSSVEITTKNASNDCSFFGQIKFNDMQNMQNSRLFIISVLITLVFTELLRRIVRLIKSIVLQHKRTTKICDNNSTRMYELTINETTQQDDDDLPHFFL